MVDRWRRGLRWDTKLIRTINRLNDRGHPHLADMLWWVRRRTVKTYWPHDG